MRIRIYRAALWTVVVFSCLYLMGVLESSDCVGDDQPAHCAF